MSGSAKVYIVIPRDNPEYCFHILDVEKREDGKPGKCFLSIGQPKYSKDNIDIDIPYDYLIDALNAGLQLKKYWVPLENYYQIIGNDLIDNQTKNKWDVFCSCSNNQPTSSSTTQSPSQSITYDSSPSTLSYNENESAMVTADSNNTIMDSDLFLEKNNINENDSETSLQPLLKYRGDNSNVLAKEQEEQMNKTFGRWHEIASENISTDKSNYDDNKIFTDVDNEAAFPGGNTAWRKYVTKAIQAYLNEFTESDFGTCTVRFIVDKTGKVSNTEVITMKGSRLAEIEINAIKTGPNWTPAIKNERYVNSYHQQEVTLSNPNQ